MSTIEERHGDEIVKLYVENGLSSDKIGNMLGYHPRSIRYVLQARNVPKREIVGKLKRTCQNAKCGKTFATWPAEVKKGGGKFCSKECSYHFL
jgi:hypothetical protein